MHGDYIRARITQLRLQKNVSEYKMSLELGQSKGYIQSITSGKTLPSMAMFLEICSYFGVTPEGFFAGGEADEALIDEVIHRVRRLPQGTLRVLADWLKLLR